MIIFLLSTVLLFWNLGSNTLSNWDEALLAAVARDHGIWNGQHWWYEPPLVTWIIGWVTRLTDSEWWLRLPNALASLVLVLAVYRRGGLISALVLLSTIEWLFRARQINVDIPLSLFLFLAVTRSSGLFLGLAAITKRASWLLAVPALIWGLRNKHWKRELGLFLLVTLPWHILSYLKFGQEFIDKYLLGFTVGKLTSVNPVTGSSPWFYIETLKHGMKFWVLALPLALIWGWRQKTWLILVATYLIGLTLAPIKASWYILPLYPVLALLIGGFLTAVFKPKPALGLVLVIIVALFNLLKWQQEWLVPQTTLHQATLAKEVKAITQPGSEVVYLDDDWLPVAVFYSQRPVVPLRFNRGDRYDEPLELPNGSLVMTNQETVANLKTRGVKLETVKQVNDLLLTRVK